ncbi:TfoX/Sxy family DNA transformation protein [Vibrio sp. SM6]|uniref:TfoX/Sxy family DNA transformation protein n=1 Tax=Vibrio agarilyticus TaxID=2726741 RepID=A0A7X8TM59_9VIBR|nr:TfoX/Sxy family DNA transformation protein [Vibrio agarilyticus]NLS11301.1 TfoX/Sxy family DNA transformation protein [Vibrio agarilyticus]
MDKPILKDSMTLFEPLGSIKSRSMFGGFGLFADETMFALVVNNKLHLRAAKDTAALYQAKGFEPYVYRKRGFPVVTKYFAVADSVEQEPSTLLELATQALHFANVEKEIQATAKPTRLKDLPNLRLGTERMLKKAGIDSVAELERSGALHAYKAVRDTHASTVSLELLWALEGAISGKHWSVITSERKQELMRDL